MKDNIPVIISQTGTDQSSTGRQVVCSLADGGLLLNYIFIIFDFA